MDVQIRETGPHRRELAVKVPLQRVQSEMEKLVESYRRKAALPGFRKGRAPTELVRVQFQGDIESDLLNELIPDAYEEALKESRLVPVSPPHFHDIRFQPGQPLEFRADVDVQPDLTVTGYRGLAVEQEIVEIDDATVDDAVEMMRAKRATFHTVVRPAGTGDVIQAVLEPIDVHGKRMAGKKKEEIRIEAGSPSLLPEFREASQGIAAGESRIVEVHYPADFGDDELAGRIRRFRLAAREIQEKKLPELDDNFAQGIDPNLDLEGLKSKLRLRLEAEELMRSKQRLEDTLVEKLLALNPFSAPDGMVEYRLGRALERAHSESDKVNDEAFRERFRPYVERVCRREILFDAIARQESLSISDEELEAELDTMAQEAGVETDVIRKKMEADGEIDRIRDTMQERKILDFLLSTAQVTRIRRPRPREAARVDAG